MCDEIDLCDVDFYRRALRRLDHDECELVVGSKAMQGSRDRRPWSRRAATKVINTMLWATLDFQGTDTHGLKAFKRAALLPVVESCTVEKDLFASEFVIRAGRMGLRIQEIPIELEEQRSPPSICCAVSRVSSRIWENWYTPFASKTPLTPSRAIKTKNLDFVLSCIACVASMYRRCGFQTKWYVWEPY